MYRDYALQGPADSILPFTGTPHIPNDDYVVSVETPQFARFSGSVFYIWGHGDDSRTGLPILIRDPSTGLYAPAVAFERNRFRLDALFSYQPTPGTVVFAGYISILAEPDGLRFGSLRRTNDGFFLKISYLFRL